MLDHHQSLSGFRKSSCNPTTKLLVIVKKGEGSRRRLKICGRTRQVIAEGEGLQTESKRLNVTEQMEHACVLPSYHGPHWNRSRSMCCCGVRRIDTIVGVCVCERVVGCPRLAPCRILRPQPATTDWIQASLTTQTGIHRAPGCQSDPSGAHTRSASTGHESPA